MDSKDVAKALKSRVFPVLRAAGFTEFRTRTAWRVRDQVIDVVDFRSLGSYLGDGIGVTSHSFGSTVGVYYKALHATPWSTEPAPARPEEYECQARRVMMKSRFQLWCWRRDVWYVNRKGTNLEAVIADVQKAVAEQALPWLLEFGDLTRALEAFESRDESAMARGAMRELLGGTLNSFDRAETVSALALACGQRDRARQAWERMLANPYYQRVADLRATAEQRLAIL